jgi:hypothetical protein
MAGGMPSAKLLIGGAAATTALGVRVARSLHDRWRLLPDRDRRQIEGMAEDLKRRALDLRGTSDPSRAGDDLRAANETFAAALVETAEADPEISAEDVHDLREELRRELERLANGSGRTRPSRVLPAEANITASRGRREAGSAPG